jgi:tRNA-dihydrouridine synthase A
VGFSIVTRPILGLFQGQPGAKLWRRTLSEHGHRGEADIKVLELAAAPHGAIEP